MSENQQQIDHWNGPGGLKWVHAQDQLDAMLAPVTDALLERAGAQPGERVIDVGCGCGTTSIALARSGAAVWGVDVSEPMLTEARRRGAGIDGLAFSVADAAMQRYTPDHDLLCSRFGVMFFADPFAAFRNLRTALCPQGRLAFVCWQLPRDNPWMAVAGRAVQPFLAPPEPRDPFAPSPWSLADPERVRAILDAAGFVAVEIEALHPLLLLGDSMAAALALQTRVGPLAQVLAELDGERRDAALDAARVALEPYCSDAGVRLPGACWLVTARVT